MSEIRERSTVRGTGILCERFRSKFFSRNQHCRDYAAREQQEAHDERGYGKEFTGVMYPPAELRRRPACASEMLSFCCIVISSDVALNERHHDHAGFKS